MTTDEIEDFKRQARQDAYNAMVARMWTDAWAMGYEAARRDVEAQAGSPPWKPDNPLFPALAKLSDESYSDLRRRAYREITEEKAKPERDMLAAIATLGRTAP